MVHRSALALLVAAVALHCGLGLGLGEAVAAAECGPGSDVCIIVDSNQDTNERDGYMTFREALMVQSGRLNLSQLTGPERHQVKIASNLGMKGSIDVNFDPAVFRPECPNNVVFLEPPGLSDPDGYTGDGLLALPPGLADPDGSSLGPGQRSVVGMGVVAGRVVPVRVVLDGSRLSSQHVGLWLFGEGAVQGITFRNFSGHAIEIADQVAHDILIGSDGDGINDAAESVQFVNNGGDVVVLAAK